ncbi:MAG: sulfurtransferase, partial [Cyanothece sp. SIO2G6]|nr:sulfurtransferase [Cyanothece sp. SIO2G6]
MDYPTPVVSAEWLHNHLNDDHVRVFDCRFALMDPSLGIRQYQSGHIPGAMHLDLNHDLSSPVQPHGGRHPLPDIGMLAETL